MPNYSPLLQLHLPGNPYRKFFELSFLLQFTRNVIQLGRTLPDIKKLHTAMMMRYSQVVFNSLLEVAYQGSVEFVLFYIFDHFTVTFIFFDTPFIAYTYT